MTLEQYALIAEIIAAVAVVISVLYLAAQVRQGNATARREAFESTISRLINHCFDDIAGNEDAARIYTQGLQDYDGLNPVEKTRFGAIMLKVVISHEPAIDTIRKQPDLMKAPATQAMHHNLLHHLTAPGGLRWWKQIGHSWVAGDYREYLDGLIAAHPRGEEHL